MLCLKDRSHSTHLCFTCWLHFIIVLCLTVSARGLNMAQAQGTVEIFPVEPTILAGTDFNLTCTIGQSSSVLAQDIKWKRGGETLPAELYSALDDKTSQLQVRKAEFQDSGLYACVSEKSTLDGGNETQVYVGEPPDAAHGLFCYCPNLWDVTCKWELGKDTNLNTTYMLQYSEGSDFEEGSCSCSDEQTCTMSGSIHGPIQLRVLSSNKLGHAISTELAFDYESETVPHPPRNVSANPIPRSRLNVTWELPLEWKTSYRDYLYYKLEYYKEGTNVWMEYPGPSDEFINGKTYAELPSPSSLDAYTVYCVRVAAKIKYGSWSQWSDLSCSRTLEQRPDAEVNVTWSSQVNAQNDSLRDVLLKWVPLSQANARGKILGYRVIRGNRSHENVTTVDDPSTTSLEIPGLERYRGYRFAIEAYNGAGPSPRSLLDIAAEQKPAPSFIVTIIVAIVVVAVTFVVIAVIWCLVKHYHLLKPVPSISMIPLERFDRVISRPGQRGAVEREVFDEPRGHRTPNGVLPNGNIPGGSHPPAGGAAANAAEDSERDYVQLREQASPDESFPLLRSNSGNGSCSGKSNSCRKMSQGSVNSTNSSGVCSDKDPESPGSTVANYGKFAKLYVQIPDSALSDSQHSGPGQPRLDSTDSGFGDNGSEYRMPSYTKLSTIPSDPGSVETSPGWETDPEGDYNGGDVYHRIAEGEPVASNQDLLLGQPTVPAYTRLSSIPAPVINPTAPSVGNEVHVTISDGTAPSFGNSGAGSV
ncbi:interleukin-6 receptor subunit beta-like isoform X2 [Patiria miniata]|uniref:Uncharacterized protein n=1 Tax=Patiria miniata TaxID=46514 RepID=A0A913ZXF0_PATMI|nr:interleukin-6 receptor subunit beta-like isoform X2 [Patiria miniata]